MRLESAPLSVRRPMEMRGTPIPRGEQVFTKNRITVARALWPRKTAANLAAKAGCSIRAAKFYLAGRDWSHEAIRALVAEIF